MQQKTDPYLQPVLIKQQQHPTAKMSGNATPHTFSMPEAPLSSTLAQGSHSRSVASSENSSAASQTRFSFYNAEDFKVVGASSSSSTKKTASPVKASQSSPHKWSPKEEAPCVEQASASHFDVHDADKFKFTNAVVDIVEANAAACAALPDNDSYDIQNLDSEEILKSLQEHEQQRLEILSGPRKVKASSGSNSTSDDQQNSHGYASLNGDRSCGENSNPYEDAIKEALQLLRRHRAAPRISAPLQPGEQTHGPDDDVGEAVEWRDSNDIDDNQKELHQAFQDLLIRTRSPPSAPATTPNGWDENTQQQTPHSDASLGDAYQAEIEVRRKQRQERMARYASRLAELKQDDDDGPPAVDTARSLDSSVDFGNVDIARGNTRQQHPWDNHRESNVGVSRSWEDDVIVSARSTEGFGTVVAPTLSNSGTVSTLSYTNRQEDDVQRGVERVLLAILDRANSRGRTSLESNFLQANPVTLQPVLQPTSQREIKTNREDSTSAFATTVYPQQDDTLVRAMSELLGPATLISTVDGTDAEDPSTSLATQEDPTPVLLATKNYDDVPSVTEGDAHDPFADRLGNEASARSNNSRFAAHIELDETTDCLYTKISSIEDSIAPVDTNVSGNFEGREAEISFDDHEVEDDRNSGSDSSIDDIAIEKILGDTDEGSGSSDDDGTSGDEYDSDEVNVGHKGVLGPLSNRSGGMTGVVLEDDSLSTSTSDDEADDPRRDQIALSLPPPTILESLSAAVSLVTCITTNDDKALLPELHRKDKYALDESKSDDESDADSVANDLMRSLCAHLLPAEAEQSGRLLDKIPEWDESNPDEVGYRIVRLNSLQLRGVQKAFDRMVGSLKQKSQRTLIPAGEKVESEFERDLRAAEDLLDEQERRLKTAERAPEKIETPLSPDQLKLAEARDSSDNDSIANTKLEEADCLAGFPGVRPAGLGEMGELEYFSLPIIFKSHVTGFEPTKDIMLEPGNVVAGQYLVEGILGSAAFSTAYKCVDLNSEEDDSGCQDLVCLKVIKNTKDFFDQSLDEIKILELLRQTGKCHDNFIVEMKTFFYHREHLIIVTELLRQNLFEFGKFIIDSGEEPYFTITRLSYITWQCLIALNFVHGMGLVHSDVKPENILLASYSRAQAKLIDFGSSCYLTDRQSSYIQSRSYRAPEVVLGLPYDGRIDVWSLGCVVAEMFTGEVTFQNDSIVSMLSRIEAICGPFPQHMVAQGRQSSRFFTKCGLLFEKVPLDSGDNPDSFSGESSEDEEEKPAHVHIFQPKRTTLAARLGFSAGLMNKFDSRKQLTPDEKQQGLFCDLVRKLLIVDPETRPTAAEALLHPAMLYAATLTEADVKYPSS